MKVKSYLESEVHCNHSCYSVDLLPFGSITMLADHNVPSATTAAELLLLLYPPTSVILVGLAWLPLTQRLLFSRLIICRECMGM
jgi:hypothetical protein